MKLQEVEKIELLIEGACKTKGAFTRKIIKEKVKLLLLFTGYFDSIVKRLNQVIRMPYLGTQCGQKCGQKVSPIPAPSFHQNEKILGNTRLPRICVGGDKRDRTADLLNAIQALSQLSYTPIFSCCARQLLYYTARKRICQENFSLFAEILPICRVKTSPVMSVTGDA